MNKALEIIKHHEGFRSKPYKLTYKTAEGKQVSEDFYTIGYGFRVDYLELDEDIAEMILVRKIHKLEHNLAKKYDWYDDLPDMVKCGVVSIAYQIGLTAFSKFKKTIAFLADSKWADAAEECLDSRWANQTPNRAKEVSQLIRNGQ